MSNPNMIQQSPPPMTKNKSEFSVISPATQSNRFETTTVSHEEDRHFYHSDRVNEKGTGSQSDSISEEQIEHVPEGTASSGKALFMLLKAFVGTGVIFLCIN